jgi:hypothetical protein
MLDRLLTNIQTPAERGERHTSDISPNVEIAARLYLRGDREEPHRLHPGKARIA